MGRGRMVAGAAAAVLLAGTACGVTPAEDGRVRVVAGFYPLQFVAEQVGGDRVAVTTLAQPGSEPHDLELKPRQVAAVVDADIVIYLRGFQPELDATVTQDAAQTAFDVTTVVELLKAGPSHTHDDQTGAHSGEDDVDAPEPGGTDPHFWLDPTRLATVARVLAERLTAVDPGEASGYQRRAASLSARLDDLDGEYTERLASCQRREILVSHAAFGYLAERYRLEQVGISGLSPEAEPTPRQISEVTAAARQHGATTIFFETLVSPRVAKAIAAEVGVATAVLDPLEGLPAGSTEDYFSVMRANLTALTDALGCA